MTSESGHTNNKKKKAKIIRAGGLLKSTALMDNVFVIEPKGFSHKLRPALCS
jgi:hypothetical protein